MTGRRYTFGVRVRTLGEVVGRGGHERLLITVWPHCCPYIITYAYDRMSNVPLVVFDSREFYVFDMISVRRHALSVVGAPTSGANTSLFYV